MRTHEDVKVLFLKFLSQVFRLLHGVARAGNGGKPRGRAVHELDATLSQNDVIGGTQPNLSVLHVALFPLEIEVRLFHVANRQFHLFHEQGCHTGIQGRGEIGKRHLLTDRRRKQALGNLKDLFHILQFLNLDPQDPIDNGEIVSGFRESHFLLGPELIQRLMIFRLGTGVNLVRPPDGC